MAAARDEILDLRRKSIAYRKTVLQAIHACGAGHTGGSLSCIDILNVLYNSVLRVRPDAPDDPDRDRYIQSKGHCVEALYVVLADRGFFPADSLRTMSRCGSDFIGHPTRKIPGIEHNTGALGHGLSIGVGCALAGRMDGRGYRTYVLLGDGELAEGSNWEALMAAAHFKLDNLVLIIDRNRLQISGPTEEVLTLEPLKARLEAFGAAACEVDGHDVEQLRQVLTGVPFAAGRPSAVIAHTVKGRGVSFIENDRSWHHMVPTTEQLERALAELNRAAEVLA